MTRRIFISLLFACCLMLDLALAAPGAQASPPASPVAADLHPFDLPDGFIQEVLAKDLGPVTAFAFRPDGSILIARKHGSVKVWREGAVLAAPYIDISDQVNLYGDRGLMGIAVHPNYPNPAYIYLAYTYEPESGEKHAESGARTARVVRVETAANGDQARPDSMVVLLGKNGAPDAAGNMERGDRPPYSCMAAEAAGSNEVAPAAYVSDCLPVDGPSHTVDGLDFGPDGALYVSAGDGTLQPGLNVRAQHLDSLAGKILRINPLSGAGYPGNPFYDGDVQSNRSKIYALGLRNPYRFTFDPAGQLVVGDVGGERYEEINRGAPGANFGWPCLEGPLPNSGEPACTGVLAGTVETTAAWHSYAHEGGYSAAIGGDFYSGAQYPAAYQGAYFFGDHNRASLLYLPAGALPSSPAEVFATNVIAPVQITQGPDGMLYVLSFVDGTLSRIRYGGDESAPSKEAGGGEPTSIAPDGAGRAPVVTILSPVTGSIWPEGATIDLVAKANDVEDGPLAGESLRWTATLLHNEHVHPDFFHGQGANAQLLFEPHGPNTELEVCLAATDSDGQTGRGCILLQQCGEMAGAQCAALPVSGAAASDEAGGDTQQAQDDAEAAAGSPHGGAAGVRREIWRDIGGATVAELLDDERFPTQPDASEVLSALETGRSGKDYGERLWGYVLPPVDGDYRFWIAADDSGELWLSTDADPANAALIARTTTWTPQHDWDRDQSQASAPITLSAGQRYYIEVRHKQADQKDNLAVAWQPPGGEREVIGEPFLAAE
jgi:glucose/arabinose dehydrogenase